MFLVTAYRIAAYYLTLVLFGLGGLVVNFLCGCAWWMRRGAASERFFQRLIHRAFRLFTGWMALARICRVRYDDAFGRIPAGSVIVANHPGLMDITYLLARIPEAVCIFKPAIRRNPLLGLAARRAGYVMNCDGVDAIRSASEKVAAGHTLVVFPEGTRTPPGRRLGALRPGFALIARRAGADVQVVRIRCNSNVLAKGRPWWKPPRLPVEVSVETGPRFAPGAEPTPAALADRLAQWWRHGADDPVPREPDPAAVAAAAEARSC